VRRNPNRPTSHDSRGQIRLELLGVVGETLTLTEIQITKEHATEDGVPEGLVNEHLGRDGLGRCTREFRVEESVKVMTCGSMNEETEGSKANCSHHIVRLVIVIDEFLGEDVSHTESEQRRAGLGEQRLRLENLIVFTPDRAHCVLLYILR